jgi:Aspartyl/Asparaginyl beta-hydroxylase/SEC-C motif
MKLTHEFYKLPLTFDVDRLRKELSAFPESAWQAHPSDYKGNLAIPLISVNGEINDDFAGPMQQTAQLKQSPYMQQVIAAFKSVCSRSRLMRLEGKHDVPEHSDINYHWWSRVRIHVPIVTTPDVIFHCGDQQVHMAPGEAWIFDSWKMHRVVNPSGKTRVHLVIDTAGSPEFWRMVESAEVVSSHPLAGHGTEAEQVHFQASKKVKIRTERFNVPAVMSAGEIDAMVEGLIQDVRSVAQNDVESVAQYTDILNTFRFAWRSIWSVHGTEKAGRLDYEMLINKIREQVLSLDSRLLLSNMSSAPQVMCARILEPALSPGQDQGYMAVESGSVGADQQDKVGRNSPCPCGSGKKYKRCHGA